MKGAWQAPPRSMKRTRANDECGGQMEGRQGYIWTRHRSTSPFSASEEDTDQFSVAPSNKRLTSVAATTDRSSSVGLIPAGGIVMDGIARPRREIERSAINDSEAHYIQLIHRLSS